MFYIVDKPKGISSNLVAKILKRVLGTKKLGFLGTLDPLASGLMIFATEGTPRLFPLIEDMPKTYEATIRLDGTTDSYDLEKPIISITVKSEIIKKLSKASLQKYVNANFMGEILQAPPMFSATWVGGKRAYDLARRGENFDIPSKKRIIHNFHILEFTWPKIRAEITVSHGTYIRSIARDLGIGLKTGGYLEDLRRTKMGNINLENIQWQEHNDIKYALISHTTLFPDIPVVELSQEEKGQLQLGSKPLEKLMKDGYYFTLYDGKKYGLLQARNGFFIPLKNNV